MENTLIITGGILLGCLIGLSWFAGSDAPYVPTKWEKVRKGLKLVNIKKGQIFYELGSGDGRVVLEAARQGAIATGIEQSWIRIFMSRYQALRQNIPNSHFIHGDIFKNDLSRADIIFIYLLHKGIDKLEPKLKKELKKNTLIITQTYHFKNWKPLKKDGDFWVYKV